MRTVCGLDIHKDSIFMCIMDSQGKKKEEKFGVSTREIRRLSQKLKDHYVTEVCMESTSIYWIPIWRLLEKDFHLMLCNPQFIKQLPGRKSDIKDAEWIATVLLKELIRESFVPDGTIQRLRQYGRRIQEINRDLVRCEQRIDMILQRCNIRLSNFVSRTKNKSYRKVVEAIISGESRSEELVKFIHGRTVNKHGKENIKDSLEGDVQQSDIDMLIQYTQNYDLYISQKQHCVDSMISLCKEHYLTEFEILISIPGIKEQSAALIISEIGSNMDFFASSASIVSWAGLSPRNDESAGKIKSRKITKGNKYLRKTLIECAWGASRTIDSVFYNRFIHLKTMKKRTNAIAVANARKLLVIIWTLLSKKEKFDKYYHLNKIQLLSKVTI